MGRGWHQTALLLVVLGACRDQPMQALGTLEYDRITLPAPVAEPIVTVEVREGEKVEAGQVLLRLDETRMRAATDAAQAEARRLWQVVEELEAGPRSEALSRARSQLAAARAQADEARKQYERTAQLAQAHAAPQSELDAARARAQAAEAEQATAEATLEELEQGTRSEQLAQARSAARSAEARWREQAATLARLRVEAPRAALVDDLPYLVGDQAPVGAPLAILLVGDAPWARVYVPEPIRARVQVGTAARAFVHGLGGALDGRVRMVRHEASFTPYYALVGDDAARLSYLAEVELTDQKARGLPAGLPVRIEFAP